MVIRNTAHKVARVSVVLCCLLCAFGPLPHRRVHFRSGAAANDSLDDWNDILAGYWSMQEVSGDRADSTSPRYTLSDNATVGSNATGKRGYTADFEDMTSEYLDYSDSNAFNASSTVAVSFWAKCETVQSQSVVSYGSTYAFWIVYVAVDGKWSFGVRQTDDADKLVTSTVSATTSWQHICAIADGTDLHIWVDGTKTTGDSYDGTIISTNSGLFVGAYPTDINHFDGFVDELAIWKEPTFVDGTERDLFAELLYNSGTGRFYGQDDWPAVDPPSTNMALWLDASRGTTIDGSDRLTDWADQSGNGIDFDQSTEGYRPSLIDDEINGRPVARFDGSDDYLTAGDVLDSVWAGTDSTFSIYVVIVPDVVADNDTLMAKYAWGSSNGEWLFRLRSSLVDADIQSLDGSTWEREAQGDSTLSTATPYALSWVYDGSQDGNDGLDRFSFEVNGSGETESMYYTNGSLSDIADGSGHLSIGALLTDAGAFGGQAYDGDIAEIIVYSAVHNAATRATVTAYLSAKYGL